MKETFFTAVLAITLLTISASAATFTVTNTNDSGAGSLRQAVADANAAATSDDIVFDASFNVPRTITLLTAITINPAGSDTLTITGPGANLLSISGNNAVGIFTVSAGDTASFNGLTLTQGNVSAGSGAAITSLGSVNISNVVFTSHNDAVVDLNNATGVSTITNCQFGPNLSNAVVVDSGSLTITGSTFTQHQASTISSAGTLTVTNSVFDSNTGLNGAAIASLGSLTVSGSTFSNNTATSSSATGLGGGAIYSLSTVAPVSATITNSTFTRNAEAGRSGGGGAIRNRGGTMMISGSTFTNNSAVVSGGAVANGDVMTITSSSFTNNSALGPNAATGDGHGGAIVNGFQLTVTDSLIAGNSSANSGGGIASINPNSAAASLNVTNTTISNNVANTIVTTSGGAGGGIGKSGPGTATVLASTIVGNRVNGGNGGGLYMDNGALSLHNSIVAHNTASAGNDISNGVINSLGYNLIRNATGATISGTTTGNIIGQDPLLGPLSFNGGGSRTHSLLAGSPAIDTGDPASFPATDQRGVTRAQDGDGTGGARADIGAFERRLTNETLANNPFDFDGDAKTDVAIFRPSGGEWWVSRSSNNSSLALQFGQSTDKIVPGDYTGDGKSDIAFFRPGSGQWFVLRSEDFSFFAFPFGIATDKPFPADYDGDGKTDPAVFRESTATWFINKSSGGTDIVGFGAAGDKPVPADYDGDGRSDIGIFRPAASGGEWWVRRSSNGTVFALQFGISTDRPTQGDFTGDGKADIAFWRPSNGNWFVLRSEDLSFYAFPFGLSDDVPAPGDYDGDGRMDAALFRPSSSTWFVQRSTAGTLIQGFGLAGDLPVPNAFIP